MQESQKPTAESGITPDLEKTQQSRAHNTRFSRFFMAENKRSENEKISENAQISENKKDMKQ